MSSDRLHWSEALSRQAEIAKQAAADLGIPLGIISIAPPETEDAPGTVGKLPTSESRIMYRGRAVSEPVCPANVMRAYAHSRVPCPLSFGVPLFERSDLLFDS